MMLLRRSIETMTCGNFVLIRHPLVGVLLLSIVGGFVPTFTKISLEGLGSWTLLATRFLSATIFLFPLVDKEHRKLKVANQLKYISLSGFGNPLFITLALVSVSASLAPPAYALTPFLVYMVNVLIGSAKISYMKVIALIGGVVGVSVVVLGDETVDLKSDVGILFLTAGVISFSAFVLISQESQPAQELPAIVRAFHFCLLSAFASSVMAVKEIYSDGFKPELNIIHILAVLFVGFIGTGWQYSFMQAMVEHQSGVVTSLFTLTQPVVGVTIAVLILAEPLSLTLVSGSVLILLAVYLFSRSQSADAK